MFYTGPLGMDWATSNRQKPGSFEERESSEFRSSLPCTGGISTPQRGPSGRQGGPSNSFSFLPPFFLDFLYVLETEIVRERTSLEERKKQAQQGA